MADRLPRVMLAVLVLTAVVTLSSGTAQAAPSNLQMPFACGETWRAATYAGHDWATGNSNPIDLNHDNGDTWELGHSVVASAPGTVTTSAAGTTGYGNYIVIDHGGGWSTLYAHLNSRSVSKDAKVTQGQKIGTVGKSGVSAVHLHYEQRLNGVPQKVTFNGSAIAYTTVYNGNPYTSKNCPATAPSGWGGVGTAKFLGGSTLASGQTILRNQYLLSGDGHFALVLQSDGNLVLYSGTSSKWSTKTSGKGAVRAVMQGDGNLVLYTSGGTAVWNSRTNGKTGARLDVQTDGNLVIRQGSTAVWNSGTIYSNSRSYFGSDQLKSGQTLTSNKYIRSGDKRYVLIMQTDGNLVLYGPGAHALWSTKTSGKGAVRAVMQGDGNLVLYTSGGTAVWNSRTNGKTGAGLFLQSDGNLVIRQNGTAVWNSGTAGKV